MRSLAARLPGTRLALLYALVATLALAAPNLVAPVFTRIYIDSILVGGLQHWLRPLLLAMSFTILIKAALTWLQQHSLLTLETRLALGSSGKFFWHVLRLPMEFFAQRFAGEIGSRVGINDRVAAVLAGVLATNAANILLIGFYAALMFQYDARLTAIGAGIAALNFLVLRLLSRRYALESIRLAAEQGKMVGCSMNGLQIIETLKSCGAESDFFARWSGYQAKVVNAEQSARILVALFSVAPPLLSGLNVAAIIGLGGLRRHGRRAHHGYADRVSEPDGQLSRPGGADGGPGRIFSGSGHRSDAVGRRLALPRGPPRECAGRRRAPGPSWKATWSCAT